MIEVSQPTGGKVKGKRGIVEGWEHRKINGKNVEVTWEAEDISGGPIKKGKKRKKNRRGGGQIGD